MKMNYNYSLFRIKENQELLFYKKLLTEFDFRGNIRNGYGVKCELYYKAFLLPTYIIYINSKINKDFWELLDGYYFNIEAIRADIQKDYKNILTKPINNNHMLITIVETNKIDDFLLNTIKYGSLITDDYTGKTNYYKIPIVFEKSTNTIYISNFPRSTTYLKNKMNYDELRNYIVEKLKDLYINKIERTYNAGEKFIQNYYPPKTIYHSYLKKQAKKISFLKIYICLFLFLQIINRDLIFSIISSLIITIITIVYTKKIREKQQQQPYEKVKLERTFKLNAFLKKIQNKGYSYSQKGEQIKITKKGTDKKIIFKYDEDWLYIIKDDGIFKNISSLIYK